MTLDPKFPVQPATGHSADVRIWLHLNGTTVPVLQSGPTAIKLQSTDGICEGDAVVEIIVDERSHRRNVRIVSFDPGEPWVTAAAR